MLLNNLSINIIIPAMKAKLFLKISLIWAAWLFYLYVCFFSKWTKKSKYAIIRLIQEDEYYGVLIPLLVFSIVSLYNHAWVALAEMFIRNLNF